MGKKTFDIFVVKDDFYKKLLQNAREKDNNIPPSDWIQFSWRGKTIFAREVLMNYCLSLAEEQLIQEFKNSKEYRKKYIKKVKEIFTQYKWVKDKKKYSRCGKWLKRNKDTR